MKTSPYVARAAQPESLTVKRLAVVDEKGTERVAISAPLPEPMINRISSCEVTALLRQLRGIYSKSHLETQPVVTFSASSLRT
jgi:hypothetical protein